MGASTASSRLAAASPTSSRLSSTTTAAASARTEKQGTPGAHRTGRGPARGGVVLAAGRRPPADAHCGEMRHTRLLASAHASVILQGGGVEAAVEAPALGRASRGTADVAPGAWLRDGPRCRAGVGALRRRVLRHWRPVSDP
ncbi:unnamed protein product [Prorocentrum cordatum]|uniref:Uncharacterized protein n=1 Tax=Prorocentrum cordatum TaxID=2364126 RepID=A0ABN9RY37_9DINO|nr:unnamed protein product [Polarella glacialis]